MGLLDDIGKGLNKMGKKTSDMAIVAKIKLEITKNKASIDKKYEELGSRMYFLHKEGLETDDSVMKLYEEIDELFEEVNRLEQELKGSEEVEVEDEDETADLTCEKCGETIAEDAKFCGSCGTAVEMKKECPNCGAEVGSAKFCNSCGTSID